MNQIRQAEHRPLPSDPADSIRPGRPPQGWALVTGASSGFGLAFCRLLAARGWHLVLAARRLEPMQQLAAQLQHQYGIQTHVIAIDLAVPGAAANLKAATDRAAIEVEILINNAGLGMFGEFLEQDAAALQSMLQLNILTLMELSHLYGAAMKARGHGRILLLASIAGFQSLPLYAAYSGSKAFVLHFGEALQQELQAFGVQLTVLAPGISDTAFFQVAGQAPGRYHRLVQMSADSVAAAGLQALFSDRPVLLAGRINRFTIGLLACLPRRWRCRLAGWVMGR